MVFGDTGEVGDALALALLKAMLDQAFCNLVERKVSLPVARGPGIE